MQPIQVQFVGHQGHPEMLVVESGRPPQISSICPFLPMTTVDKEVVKKHMDLGNRRKGGRKGMDHWYITPPLLKSSLPSLPWVSLRLRDTAVVSRALKRPHYLTGNNVPKITFSGALVQVGSDMPCQVLWRAMYLLCSCRSGSTGAGLQGHAATLAWCTIDCGASRQLRDN